MFIRGKVTEAGTGGSTYYLRVKAGVYTGAIGTALGISEAPPAEQSKPQTEVDDLLNAGTVIRLVATVLIGTDERRTVKLLCERSKILTAAGDLIGQAFRGGTIRSVRIPTKATFY